LGRGVGSFNVFGCELVRRGFGISVEMEFDEVRVLDDGVDNVVVISCWFGFGKPILNTFG
jgi:predicted amidohydrolase